MINTNSPGCMYIVPKPFSFFSSRLQTWVHLLAVKSQTSNINTKKNHTSLRLLLSGKSHIEKVHLRKENTAALRRGIPFRLVAVLLTSKSESESEKKFRRSLGKQVNDVLVGSSGPFGRYMYLEKRRRSYTVEKRIIRDDCTTFLLQRQKTKGKDKKAFFLAS